MDQSVAVSKAAPVLKSTDESQHPANKKLGLVLLSGVVVGSMIGGGSFNLPANMASSAGLAAIMIAWVITCFSSLMHFAYCLTNGRTSKPASTPMPRRALGLLLDFRWLGVTG